VKVAGSNPATPTKKLKSYDFSFSYFIKMCTVYILFSEQLQKYYVGYSSKNIKERLKEHLYNHKGFTAKTKDWNIIYQLKLNSKSEALLLEKKIKKRGAKRYLNDIASR